MTWSVVWGYAFHGYYPQTNYEVKLNMKKLDFSIFYNKPQQGLLEEYLVLYE